MQGQQFTNFSKINKECPRCGEINDKCGLFEESGLVMCRVDIGDSVEPRLDANDWEYWPYQIGIGDAFIETYKAFHNALPLSFEDKTALNARGLSDEEIERRGYKTIPHRVGNSGLNEIVDILDSKFDLKGVPGFYIDDTRKRNINAKYKQTLIPVRNFQGAATQFILRNNSTRSAKSSKYIMLSSDNKEEGQKTDQQVHFPLGVKNCTHEVRITEGILKADIATSLGDVYCIGLHGLSSRGLLAAIEMLGVSKVRIALDVDWQENRHVMNGLRRLYNSVEAEGFEVVVEEWNKSDGKGIDDVLFCKGQIWEIPKEEVEFMMERPDFQRSDWVYVNKTSQFAKVDCEPPYLMDEKHFNNHFVKMKEDYAKEAKTIVRQVDRYTYKPIEGQIVFEEGFPALNLWSNTGIGPNIEGGDLTVFHRHLEYIFPDEKQRIMFLDWMSNVLRYRGKKFSYAILVHGEEGTGKTWMVHCLSLILGLSNVEYIDNDYLHSSFNSMLQSKELLIIDEVMSEGRREFMNKMKSYVDRKDITVNIKGVPEYKMPFLANWFLTTNYDDALLIDDSDRRYLVLSSPAVCGDDAQASSRGQELFQWSGGGKEDFPIQEANLSALHAFLVNREVKYNPFAKAPITTAKAQMVEESLTPFEKFIKERIEEEMWPFNVPLVCIEHIKMLPAIEKRFGKVSPHRWGKALKQFGGVHYGSEIDDDSKIVKEGKTKIRMKSEDGKQRRIWILKSPHLYLQMTSAEIEEKYLSAKPASDEPELPAKNGNDDPL